MTQVESRRDAGGWAVRWNPAVAKRAAAGGDWPNRTVAQFAQQRAVHSPNRVLLIDGELELTCGDLYQRARRLAGYFVSIGLNSGDVVSFQLPNWWEASVIDIAASMIGVVLNPIVPINRDAEVTYMLNESRSRVMFVPGVFRMYDYAAMLRRILPALNSAPRVVVVRAGAGEFEAFGSIEASRAVETPLPIDPNAVKLLLYTSGTTGRPKGVLHSHNSIHADSTKMKAAMHLTDDDTLFCPSPVTHISGYLWALNMPWYGNMRAVMQDIWDPDAAFELMARHECAFMVGATPFLQGLVQAAKKRGHTLPRLKYFMCGGASVPPSLIYEAAELFPNCIPWRTFGATESPTMTGPPATRRDLRLAAETDGRLNRAEVRVVDIATGVPRAEGEEGEILVREPSMALGYARAEDNEGAYDADGYFRTGDIGKIVDVDHIVCTGRKKDLIIRSGENISAKEVEDAIYRSPRVIDVAVVSMPSRRTGEAICAFIVTRPGDTISLAEVSAMVWNAGLARQKAPVHIELIAELPKTPSGKVRKDLLRERARHCAAD
jgi:acyl-CoA synthetase (AMP-forming)/AMP-acid ligase II